MQSKIPSFVIAPATESQPERRCEVAGHGTLKKCPNPNCNRYDENGMLYLLLEPGNMWPNFVIECGSTPGCGAYWAMIGAPPQGATVYDESQHYLPR